MWFGLVPWDAGASRPCVPTRSVGTSTLQFSCFSPAPTGYALMGQLYFGYGTEHERPMRHPIPAIEHGTHRRLAEFDHYPQLNMDQPTSIWSKCLDYATLSDLGLRRANNQDACAVVLAGNQADFEQCGHLFMVADGMGAHAAGEMASKMATDVVPLVYRKRIGQSPPEAIVSAVLDANQQIHHRGQATLDYRGMGTTATTLLMLPAGVFVAHVGDSREYRLRGTHLEQLTFDHSLVWEMRAAGRMPEAEIPGYISKNIITAARWAPVPRSALIWKAPTRSTAATSFVVQRRTLRPGERR